MEMPPILRELCYDDKGQLKPKDQCRAAMINHLILDQGMGVDAAEDIADKSLRESGFWPVPKFDWEEEEEKNNIS